MTTVGGFNVRRLQNTFDYVDITAWCTGVRSVRRPGKHCGAGWLSTAPMGTVSPAGGLHGAALLREELAAAGVGAHRGDAAEIVALRRPRSMPRPTLGCCARCWRAEFPASGMNVGHPSMIMLPASSVDPIRLGDGTRGARMPSHIYAPRAGR